MRSKTRFAALTLVLVSLAATLSGQNLLSNPNFNSSVASWGVQAWETAVWKNVDANNSPSSGAADLTNSFTGPGTLGGGSATQCVAVSGGTSYDFGAKAFIPTQAKTGYAQVQAAWFSGPSCGGDSLFLDATSHLTQVAAWEPLDKLGVTAPATAVSAYIALAHFKDGAGGSFITYFDDAYLRPAAAPSGILTLPSVASVHGANQTFFHSDVWILNRSFTNSQSIIFHYRCLAGLSCAAAPQNIVLAPRESRLFSDIVVSTLGSPETGGALEIVYDASDGELTAASRLYTPSLPSPTSGFSLPALPSSEARSRAVFVGLGGSGGDLSQGFRTNVGAYNPNASPVTVTFTLHGALGAVLGSPVVRNFTANQALQINDIFGAAGAGSTVTANAYLVVTTNGLPVFPYAAVVDNKSGDSVWVIPSDDEAP